MPRYCVDGESQPNGDHVVHNLESCSHLPDRASRLDLGEHESCIDAVAKARVLYKQANGCWICSRACYRHNRQAMAS